TTMSPLSTIGTMRRFSSAARTATPEAISAASPHIHTRRRIISTPLSVPNRQRHMGAPERQLLGPNADADSRVLSADTAEVAHVPVQPESIRQEPCHAAADIHRRQHARDRERVKILVVSAHQPATADDIWAQR